MDERQAAELELHVQTLKTELEARTGQLKDAVGMYEKLIHLVKDALLALRQIEDPTVKHLVENCGLAL